LGLWVRQGEVLKKRKLKRKQIGKFAKTFVVMEFVRKWFVWPKVVPARKAPRVVRKIVLQLLKFRWFLSRFDILEISFGGRNSFVANEFSNDR